MGAPIPYVSIAGADAGLRRALQAQLAAVLAERGIAVAEASADAESPSVPDGTELALVEGSGALPAPVIEVATPGEERLVHEPARLLALVTDDPCFDPFAMPVFGSDEIADVADRIEDRVLGRGARG